MRRYFGSESEEDKGEEAEEDRRGAGTYTSQTVQNSLTVRGICASLSMTCSWRRKRLISRSILPTTRLCGLPQVPGTITAEAEQNEGPEEAPVNARQHTEEATTSGRTEDGTPAAPSSKKACSR